MSHDIRTPLNSLLGMLVSTRYMTDIGQFQNTIEDSIKIGQFLKMIVDDLMDYSQINEGVLRLAPELFDVSQAVNNIIWLLQNQAEAKKLKLFLDTDQLNEKDRMVYNDINRFKQVLMNLLTNAIKFTEKGSVTVQVKSLPDQPDQLQVSVKDTGVGIPEQIREKLFTPFATFDQKGLNKHGVGLGLTICQKFVKNLGKNKTIELSTIVNQGTTFSFNIYTCLN